VNLIALDIGNTNIGIGFFLNDREELVRSVPNRDLASVAAVLKSSWAMLPVISSSGQNKRDGAIVASSVNPQVAEAVADIVRIELGEKMQLIGRDIPLSLNIDVDEPSKVGSDRLVAAAAAYAVVEEAVVVADFGTAITIDLVDDEGTFLGGVILPGFELSSAALSSGTALLPKVEITRPQSPFGKNTREAINCGIYWSGIATLQEITRRFAEYLGKWPKTIITGGNSRLIKEDCGFIDSFVDDLVVRGIALVYREHLRQKAE
jgi:type III pantothenate kinase